MRTREPVLWVMSALAGLQVMAAAGNLTELIGGKPAAWLVLTCAALQAASQFWVRSQVTPVRPPESVESALKLIGRE
jgi:hypothetical protein